MTDLLLAILCSTAIGMILKFSETREMNRYLVTTMNYVVAFSISLILSPVSDIGSISFGSFLSEIRGLPEGAKLSLPSSLAWAVNTGLIAGVLYFLGFVFIQKNIKESGVGITGAVSKTGIVVPVVLSMILWREIPNFIQGTGILLSFAAILLINLTFGEMKVLKNLKISIILLFFIAGFAEFSNKIFEKYAMTDHKAVYLFTVFFTAFWISLFFTVKGIRSGSKIRNNDIVTGLIVGVPNMFTSFFLIRSFETYKASVAFPIYSSGSILLMTLGGVFLFGERIKRKDVVAIGMIILAIVLMNVR